MTADKLGQIALRAVLAYVDTFLGLLTAGGLGIISTSVLRVAAAGALAPAISVLRNSLSAFTAVTLPTTMTQPASTGKAV